MNTVHDTSLPAQTWYVYLVRCADQSLYCGITTNVSRRLAQHNGRVAGGAKYTKPRRPVKYAHIVTCASRSEAMKLEIHIKKIQKPAAKIQYMQTLAPFEQIPEEHL